MHLKQNILFPREIAHTEQFSVACARFVPCIGVASTLNVDAIDVERRCPIKGMNRSFNPTEGRLGNDWGGFDDWGSGDENETKQTPTRKEKVERSG